MSILLNWSPGFKPNSTRQKQWQTALSRDHDFKEDFSLRTKSLSHKGSVDTQAISEARGRSVSRNASAEQRSVSASQKREKPNSSAARKFHRDLGLLWAWSTGKDIPDIPTIKRLLTQFFPGYEDAERHKIIAHNREQKNQNLSKASNRKDLNESPSRGERANTQKSRQRSHSLPPGKTQADRTYSHSLSELLRQARSKYPKDLLPEAVIKLEQLAQWDINKYFLGSRFKGEKFNQRTLELAVATGQPDIATKILETDGHNYTEEEKKQWLDLANISYKEKVNNLFRLYKTDKGAFEKAFYINWEDFRGFTPEMHAAALAAPEGELKKGSSFYYYLIETGPAHWGLVKNLKQRGAADIYEHAKYMAFLDAEDNGIGGQLGKIKSAVHAGIAQDPNQFLIGLTRMASKAGNLQSETLRFFNGLREQNVDLTKIQENGTSVIDILRSNRAGLKPELQAFVDSYPKPSIFKL